MAIRERTIHLSVEEEQIEAIRLDLYVIAREDSIPRSAFSREETSITVNGRPAKKGRKVRAGDTITLTWTEECYEGLVAQSLDLDILYEDEEVVVINKEQGLTVHPGAGNWDGTLANALVARYGEAIRSVGDPLRPGIVHRLDKDTSGAMVVAKTQQSFSHLSEQFRSYSVERVYVALVEGIFANPHASIELPIIRHPVRRTEFTIAAPGEGREAHTEYRVVRSWTNRSLLRLELYTGRTHQIRVHLKAIGHPVVGDPIYSSSKEPNLMLHSLILSFTHPRSNETIRCIAALPRRLSAVLRPPADRG